MEEEQKACVNTDKEIWRKEPDKFYSPSIFVTRDNDIGINVGGYIIQASVEEWHRVMEKSFREDPVPQVTDWKDQYYILMKEHEELKGIAELRDEHLEKAWEKIEDLRQALYLVAKHL